MIWVILLLFVSSAPAAERVVGGNPSTLHPARVSLVYAEENSYDGYFCGGTLVRPRWVLTAAHCVDKNRIDAVFARRNLQVRTGERIGVVAKYIHPSFERKSLRYDTALLRLARAPRVEFVSVSEAQSGGEGIVAGWGYTRHTRPAVIHSARAQILPASECRWNYGSFFDEKTMFCALGQEQNICQGDSGSGLLLEGLVVGVVSWSSAGCEKYPDGYARLDSTWLERVFAKQGPWRGRQTSDPGYIETPPVISWFFSTEKENKETFAELRFYSSPSLLRARIWLQGKQFCILPGCLGAKTSLRPAVGRREWFAQVRFRGCIKIFFRGRVAEGKYRGKWTRAQSKICA